MYTLRDILLTLQKLDVRPSEIEISRELYNHIIQQARELLREEGEEDEFTEPIDEFYMK